MNRHLGKGMCLGLLLLFSPVDMATLEAKEGQKLYETMIPTISELDFNRVSFLVISNSEYIDRLQARAEMHFPNAGLYKPNRPDENLGKVGSLLLTLWVDPISECGQKKFLYHRKLEFKENVVPIRNPNITVRSVTWFYGIARPAITDKVTIEQLEAELDKLIEEFIRSYKWGNP